MHCVAKYPHHRINQLRSIDYWRGVWRSGRLSDHSREAMVNPVAMARGGNIIEKHFTIKNVWPARPQVCD